MSLKSVAFCSVAGWYGDGVSYIIAENSGIDWLPNLNALVVVSKGMRAVKLCSYHIPQLQFETRASSSKLRLHFQTEGAGWHRLITNGCFSWSELHLLSQASILLDIFNHSESQHFNCPLRCAAASKVTVGLWHLHCLWYILLLCMFFFVCHCAFVEKS